MPDMYNMQLKMFIFSCILYIIVNNLTLLLTKFRELRYV